MSGELSKRTYESIGSIAEALPEAKCEEFAALLDDFQRASMHPDSLRRNAIRRWLCDINWPVSN